MPSWLVQILAYACGLGRFKLGEIRLDGTNIKANASQPQALSWAYACKLAAQVPAEVATWLDKAASDCGPKGRSGRPRNLRSSPGQVHRPGIAHHAGGGRWLYATANAPATVDRATGLSVGNLRQHPKDPQEGAPALAGIGPLPASLGKGEPAAWDAGVFKAHTIQQCGPSDIEPSITAGRPTPDPSLAERFAPL